MPGLYTTGQSIFNSGGVTSPLGDGSMGGNATAPPSSSDPFAGNQLPWYARPQQISAPQAIRPSTGGAPNQPGVGQFDQSYLQNLATYIGGLFQRPGGGQPLSFNPVGNLTDLPGTKSQGGGNAPTQGLPPTMLGNAINTSQATQPSAFASWLNPTQGTTGA